MTDNIGRLAVPLSRQMQVEQQGWLAKADKGGEIRAKVAEDGHVAVYNAKRGIFGSAVSAIKDAGGSEERAANRLRAAGEFNAFLNDRFGSTIAKHVVGQLKLDGGSLQAADVRRAIGLGQALEAHQLREAELEPVRAAHVEREALQRVSNFGVQPLDPTRLRPQAHSLAQAVDTRQIPVEISQGIEANNGFSTPALVKWLIQDGRLDIGIDPDDPSLNVRPLPRTGSYTGELYAVEVQGRLTHIVKETGGPFLYGDNRATTVVGYKAVDGVLRSPGGFENEKIRMVSDSIVGRNQRFEAPGGVTVGFALAPATLRYNAKGITDSMEGRPTVQQFAHEVTVLEAAPGKSISSILDSGTVAEQQAAAKALGQAIGAMHRKFADGAELPTGGLRTIVHGDLHPGNVFYDSQSGTVTLIDLAGMVNNFDQEPHGLDMLRDIKRVLTQGSLASGPQFGAVPRDKVAQTQLQDAFLRGYAENFADLTDMDGQPRYSPDKVRALIANPDISAVGLT